jgi:hypothetical protein
VKMVCPWVETMIHNGDTFFVSDTKLTNARDGDYTPFANN